MSPLSYPLWTEKYELKPGLWIFKPTEETIERGKVIKDAIKKNWSPPCYYFHLLPGGHVAALYMHRPNQFFAHLDIAKFFDSINRSRVTRSLKELFDYETAREYTLASTVKHPAKSPITYMLPYGFVQSPILASISLRFSALGRKLDNLSRAASIQVSVYMDDIIISGNDCDNLKMIVDEVKASAERADFILNKAKEEGPSSRITAFNIKLAAGSLEIESTRYRELQEHFRYTSNPMVKKGVKTYVASVNSGQLAGL